MSTTTTLTLSIKNPWPYLIAAGVKDVENRSWTTNYRGRLLLHASADDYAWPGGEWLPKALYELAAELIEVDTPREALPSQLRGYAELCDYCERRLPGFDQTVWRDPGVFYRDLDAALKKYGPPLRGHAIVGEATLIDVVRDSTSLWAEPNQFHWIMSEPVLYDTPILGVKGHLKLWHYKP
jgi:hypothetical protein